MYAPKGISWIPKAADPVQIIRNNGSDGECVCMGVPMSDEKISVGELKLTSEGGMSIYLKNNEILIGVVSGKQDILRVSNDGTLSINGNLTIKGTLAITGTLTLNGMDVGQRLS